MVEQNRYTDFLQTQYPNLAEDPALATSRRRAELHAEGASGDVGVLAIEDYMDKFRSILTFPNEQLQDTDPEEYEKQLGRRNRRIQKLKTIAFDNYVSRPEDLEPYLNETLPSKGINLSEEEKRQRVQRITESQRSTLGLWIDELTSKDITAPEELKYWVFRGVLNMGQWNREKNKHNNRKDRGTIEAFPQLNQQALVTVLDCLEIKYGDDEYQRLSDEIVVAQRSKEDNETRNQRSRELKARRKQLFEVVSLGNASDEEKKDFLGMITRSKSEPDNFNTLYSAALKLLKPVPKELLQITQGEWVTYSNQDAAQKVFDRIREHNHGWCLTDTGAIANYLKKSNIRIFYSNDEFGQPKIPRIAVEEQVREDDGTPLTPENYRLLQVKGILPDQYLDEHIKPIVKEHLGDHPDWKSFQKIDEDTKKLDFIYWKMNLEQGRLQDNGVLRLLGERGNTLFGKYDEQLDLTPEQLRFLYEIDGGIEGFGYNRDPRISELRDKRRADDLLRQDMLAIFGCTEEEIATSVDEITDRTKVYEGEIGEGLFARLPATVEAVYRSFPDDKVEMKPTKVGGMQMPELREKAVAKADYNYADTLLDTLHNEEIRRSDAGENIDDEEQNITLIQLSVGTLFDDQGSHTLAEVLERADKVGLEICQPKDALYYVLEHGTEVAIDTWRWFAMNPLADDGQTVFDGGAPWGRVFAVGRDGGGPHLREHKVRETSHWDPRHKLVFRRK